MRSTENMLRTREQLKRRTLVMASRNFSDIIESFNGPRPEEKVFVRPGDGVRIHFCAPPPRNEPKEDFNRRVFRQLLGGRDRS